ncbi:MAG: SRPBCC family protein [Methylotenera sp.]|uniref:SRPBCC family protein n=1 Tax=Methylotenera sp. TaxID=2051956 RepID=UPI0024893958|nr:SRPBCC family protein [Methylotenera sp.]MDI1309273.1 SRPBCC family protein [Methylotenera sp.]
MEHHNNSGGECGVGSVRHCALHGMGGLDETIVWWNPPHGYAFKVDVKSKIMMPTKDHFSVMLIEPHVNGGSTLTWRHYFNWRSFFMRHVTAVMLPMMMRKAIDNIRKELGEKYMNKCHTGAGCNAMTHQNTCCK